MQIVEKGVDSLQNVGYYIVNPQNVGGDIDVGLTMKQWRLAKGISQEVMAKRCGVHRNTYAAWEDNPDNVSIKHAKLIASALNESVDVIFFTK